MILKSLEVGAIGTNCYIFGDEATQQGAIVDPGDEPERILAAVKSTGLEIRLILLTHGHFDHTTAVPAISAAFPDAPVYLSKLDRDEMQNGGLMGRGTGEVAALRSYKDGDTLTVGGLTVQVLETPGHTPGSVTLLVGDVLFTGDTLFAGSIGRTDFPGGSYSAMNASLRRLGELPGSYKVCPGHMDCSDLDTERARNMFLRDAMGV